MDEAALMKAPKETVIEVAKAAVQKTSRLQKSMAKAKEIAEQAAMVVVAAGISVGVAGLWGYLVTKNPDIAKIPGTEIDTDLAVGAAAVLGSLFLDQSIGRFVAAGGVGLLAPWGRDMGVSIAER